jgi:hypothetical protein
MGSYLTFDPDDTSRVRACVVDSLTNICVVSWWCSQTLHVLVFILLSFNCSRLIYILVKF